MNNSSIKINMIVCVSKQALYFQRTRSVPFQTKFADKSMSSNELRVNKAVVEIRKKGTDICVSHKHKTNINEVDLYIWWRRQTDTLHNCVE